MRADHPGVYVRAMATCVPPKKVFFEEDAKKANFPDKQVARIKKTIGLNTRHVVTDGVTALDLCARAAEKVLAALKPGEDQIDGLIFVTQSPDHFQPCNAAILHGKLGLDPSCAAFDINLGCSGFVYGLSVAASMLNSSDAGNILLLAGDTLSTTTNERDRSAGFLFGDAGSATLISKGRADARLTVSMHTDGTGQHHIKIPAGGFRMPKSSKTAVEVETDDGNILSDDNLQMDGGAVFNFAVSVEPDSVNELLQMTKTQRDDIDYVFFHQANKYFIGYVTRKLGFSKEQVPDDILELYGNQSSASIPCAICHTLGGKITGNYDIIVSGFGVGLSWASAFMTFQPEFCPPVFELE
ncbi:MAG: hypothetical protein CBE26_02015 [Kiritimatiellaceae bacterium TMED266]|nr:MAG: hypothetical protein CBE26_02015 [Kiritimatiellaceae bacterium TMED266]